MLSTFLSNLVAFGLSMPTNLVIILIICVIMKLFCKKSIKDCLKVVAAYLLIGLLLGIFGITMPNFLQIGQWFVNVFKQIW